MPEGDTIYKVATAMRPKLLGETLQHVDSRYPERVRGLVGTTVDGIEPVGKHLLIHFSDKTTLRTHLGMKGNWHSYRTGERWKKPFSQMGVVLQGKLHEVVCFFPKAVDRFRTRERPVHPVLSKLGPDLLSEDFPVDDVVERAMVRAPARTAGDLLLDQEVACGIGNVYKCEVLFLEKVNPFIPATEIDRNLMRRLYTRAHELMRANMEPGARNTTGGRNPATWVYGANRRPCPICRSRVLIKKHGDFVRLTWWCPKCQQVVERGPKPVPDDTE